uniref:Uncharacterized protein n=1 Tax=Parascaris equorum TaxID=6256 RepID=A0A914S3U0_PAREQ
MRKGVIDLTVYNNSEAELIFGQISVLSGCGAWLYRFRPPTVSSVQHWVIRCLPVALKESDGGRLCAFVVLSWFISPVLSGIVSIIFYVIIDHAVLRRNRPLHCGLILLPILYFFCVAVNVFAIVFDGILGFDKIPLWGVICLAFGSALIVSIFVQFFVAPRLKRRILESTVNEVPAYSNNGVELKSALPSSATLDRNAANSQSTRALLQYENSRQNSPDRPGIDIENHSQYCNGCPSVGNSSSHSHLEDDDEE